MPVRGALEKLVAEDLVDVYPCRIRFFNCKRDLHHPAALRSRTYCMPRFCSRRRRWPAEDDRVHARILQRNTLNNSLQTDGPFRNIIVDVSCRRMWRLINSVKVHLDCLRQQNTRVPVLPDGTA